MSKDRDKADKLIALALDPAAEDGEWRAAACAYFAIFRRRGFTFDDFVDSPADPVPPPLSVMPFGKFKGWAFHTIPINYLQWLYDNLNGMSPELRNRINFEIQNRS